MGDTDEWAGFMERFRNDVDFHSGAPEFVDAIGQPLKVGDLVVWSGVGEGTYGYGLLIWRITELSQDVCLVDFVRGLGQTELALEVLEAEYSNGKTTMVPDYVLKINQEVPLD